MIRIDVTNAPLLDYLERLTARLEDLAPARDSISMELKSRIRKRICLPLACFIFRILRDPKKVDYCPPPLPFVSPWSARWRMVSFWLATCVRNASSSP